MRPPATGAVSSCWGSSPRALQAAAGAAAMPGPSGCAASGWRCSGGGHGPAGERPGEPPHAGAQRAHPPAPPRDAVLACDALEDCQGHAHGFGCLLGGHMEPAGGGARGGVVEGQTSGCGAAGSQRVRQRRSGPLRRPGGAAGWPRPRPGASHRGPAVGGLGVAQEDAVSVATLLAGCPPPAHQLASSAPSMVAGNRPCRRGAGAGAGEVRFTPKRSLTTALAWRAGTGLRRLPRALTMRDFLRRRCLGASSAPRCSSMFCWLVGAG